MIDPGTNRIGPDPLLVSEMARAREVEHTADRRQGDRGRWPTPVRVVQVLGLICVAVVLAGWLLTLLAR